jgi:hypothetical protein
VKWEALMQRKDNIMAKEKGQTCGTGRVTLNDLTTMYIYRFNAGYAQLNELFFKETMLAIMNYKERSRHGT